MQQIDTGSPWVFRFDNALDAHTCRRLCDLVQSRTAKAADAIDMSKLPWLDSDTFAFDLWEDQALRQAIGAYRVAVSQLVALTNRQIVFPHFTDLVLWRPGKHMDEHKDDGYPGDDDIMKVRHFSAVTYCNDDYQGGETFIRCNDQGGYYESTPKTGSLVFYPSDQRATHGVRKVQGGDRVTLSTWLTRDPQHYRP